MALDPPNTWGQKIQVLVKALGIQAGVPISDAQLSAVWTAVKTEDTAQLGKSAVAPGSFVGKDATPISGQGGPVT